MDAYALKIEMDHKHAESRRHAAWERNLRAAGRTAGPERPSKHRSLRPVRFSATSWLDAATLLRGGRIVAVFRRSAA